MRAHLPKQILETWGVSGLLDLTSVISHPLISKLVSMKVTVCGNGNRMGWWLLSVKTAHMASVARCKAKLRVRHKRRGCEPVWLWDRIQGLEASYHGLLDSTDLEAGPLQHSFPQALVPVGMGGNTKKDLPRSVESRNSRNYEKR